MPRETLRNIPRGPGSNDPAFTPDVGLRTPGLGIQPQQSALEQLRDVLFSAGQSLASGLQAAGAIQQRMEAKREEVIRDQDRQLAEAQQTAAVQKKTFDQQRQQQVEMQAQNLILDERASNPRWLEAQAEIHWKNAATPEEREIWFRLTAASRNDVKQLTEDEERKRQRNIVEDVNLAGMTAGNIISTLNGVLAQDPSLQQELIADGENIQGNVQEWILGQIHETNPDLFVVHPDDQDFAFKARQRDALMAQVIKQSIHVGDGLINLHIKQLETNNEGLAADKLDALVHGIQVGDTTDPQLVTDTLADINSKLLGHLSTAQKEQFKNQMVEKAAREAASMLYTQDFSVAKTAAETLITASGLTESNAARIRAVVQDQFVKSAVDGYTQKHGNAVAGSTTIVSPATGLMKGKSMVVPNPYAELQLAQIDPKTGQTGNFALAKDHLATMGIDINSPTLSIEDAQIRDRVLIQVETLNRQAQAMQGTLDAKVQSRIQLQQGVPFDSSKAWDTNTLTLALQGGINQTSTEYRALSEAWKQYYGNEEMPWDGQAAYQPTLENQKLTSLMAEYEAKQWRGNRFAEIPASLSQNLSTWMKSPDPALKGMAIDFYHAGGVDMQRKIQQSSLDDQAKALLALGTAWKYQSRGEFQSADLGSLSARLGQITEARADQAGQNARAQAAAVRVGDKYRTFEYADALSKTLINQGVEDAGLEGFLGKDKTGADADVAVRTLFDNQTEDLERLYFSAGVYLQTPGVDNIDQAMALALSDLWSQGNTIADTPKGKRIVYDPFNHLDLSGLSFQTDDHVSEAFRLQLQTPFQSPDSAKSFAQAIGANKGAASAMGLLSAGGSITPSRIIADRLKDLNPTKTVPDPATWTVEMTGLSGQPVDNVMRRPEGGMPMRIHIPGWQQPIEFFDMSGNPVLLFSSKRIRSVPKEINTDTVHDWAGSTLNPSHISHSFNRLDLSN